MTLLQQFSRDIGRLLDHPHNTHDVIIRVGEGTSQKEIKVHSIILNSRCPYFQKLLTKSENFSKENGIIVFEKRNHSPKTFKIILKYLYTGEIELKDHDTFDILQILILADELELTVLTQHLLQHFIEDSSKHLYRNPLKFLQILSCHDGERFYSLKDYCIEIICEDPKRFLFVSPEFLLSEKRILLSILHQDFLNVDDEIQVWNHVLKWGIAQMPSSQMVLKTINNWTKEESNLLKEILSDFIPIIRWMEISLNDVLNKVAPYSNVLPKDFCREIFNAHRTVTTTTDPVDPEPTLLKEISLMDYIKSLPPRFPLNSLLITPRKVAYVASWIDKERKDHYSIDPKSTSKSPYTFKLLYRASRDGYDAKTFHELCDNKGPTVMIAKISKKNLLIGGYNPLDWKPKYDSMNGNSMYQTENSFLFCFGKGERKEKSGKVVVEGKPKAKSKISKLIKVTNPQKAIYYSPTNGPCFGGGCDLGIINNQMVSYGSPSYDGINRFIKEGSHFDLDDYEVFQVVKSE